MRRRFCRAWDRSWCVRALVVYGAWALLAWLDAAPRAPATHAGVFGFVVIGLQAIWAALSTVNAAITTALEWVVHWLVGMVTWIAGALKDITRASGVIFSRVWDVFDSIWQRILRPFLVWLDNIIVKVRDWLKRVFGPVFEWLNAARHFITDLYDRFVRPVLDLLDWIHQLRTLLDALHIHLLDGLDDFLQSVERKLDAIFGWIYSKLALLGYWVDVIITADGFFQRYTLLRSEARYIRQRWQLLVNARNRVVSTDTSGSQFGKTPRTFADVSRGIRDYLATGSGSEQALIDEQRAIFQQYLRA